MGRIRGLDKLQRRIMALGSPKAERAIETALFQAGERVSDYAKASIMRGSQSGKGHVPSKPGSPPSNDSGVLHGNVEVAQTGRLEVTVGSYAPYSEALEFGTSKMEARPFLRPARDAKRKEAKRIVAAAVNKVTKGV